MSGCPTMTRQSDSFCGARHCALTVVLHSSSVPDKVQTRGRSSRSMGSFAAASAVRFCNTSNVKHAEATHSVAPGPLAHFDDEAGEGGRDARIGDDRAAGDGAAEVFVVDESVERPALGQRPRVAQLDERIDR
jgi:hypothetical protein